MLDIERITELKNQNGRLAIATVVRTHGSTPRDIGAKMIILPDGTIEGTIGGGKLEQLVVNDTKRLLQKGGFLYKQYKLLPKGKKGIGTQCGGDVDVFIEILDQSDHLVILGAGHIGQALQKIAQILDFKVTLIDDRKEFAVSEKFKGSEVKMMRYSDKKICDNIKPNSYVIVVTHAHMNDTAALKNVLKSKAKYIGMIGSRRKVKKIKEQLLRQGVSKRDLDKVYTPVGLDIGAETPSEIAVSIISEIIHVKRYGKPSIIGMGRKQ